MNKPKKTKRETPPGRPGYRGRALECLKYFGVGVGDEVLIETKSDRVTGRLVARGPEDSDEYLAVKLPSGYEMGVAVSSITRIIPTGSYSPSAPKPQPAPRAGKTKDRPRIKILFGGASPLSVMARNEGQLTEAWDDATITAGCPALTRFCLPETKEVIRGNVTDIGAKEYKQIAEAVTDAFAEGIAGVVVSHARATVAYTAAAIAFMVQKPPVPVVFVPAPGLADVNAGAVNLERAALLAAEGDIAEVVLCAPAFSSNRYALAHRATRVRQLHPTARGGFKTIGDTPLAQISARGITPLRSDYARRAAATKNWVLTPTFENKVALVYYYPNMDRDLIDAVIDRGFRGLIVAAAGTGTLTRACYPALKRARDAGIATFLVVASPWGSAAPTGEDATALRDTGITLLGNMLAETAYLKLCWVLGQTDDLAEIRRVMVTPVAGEATPREAPDEFLVLQSGVPEIKEFLEYHPL